jgi:hypothetical protein
MRFEKRSDELSVFVLASEVFVLNIFIVELRLPGRFPILILSLPFGTDEGARKQDSD